jgi:hypothetical protein
LTLDFRNDIQKGQSVEFSLEEGFDGGKGSKKPSIRPIVLLQKLARKGRE